MADARTLRESETSNINMIEEMTAMIATQRVRGQQQSPGKLLQTRRKTG
jgi:flagellar basal body rod protein FlgG